MSGVQFDAAPDLVGGEECGAVEAEDAGLVVDEDAVADAVGGQDVGAPSVRVGAVLQG